MKIAPELERVLDWHELKPGSDKRARAELRALLAVAVAAEGVSKRYLKLWRRNANRKDDVLVRALARLSRVSGKGDDK